ncbi:MAG: hypothetical protein CMB99_12425 [Flavobacteriaceae bacterium]|nr:hypothetical protein [Flavobacteriaceae bacterium]
MHYQSIQKPLYLLAFSILLIVQSCVKKEVTPEDQLLKVVEKHGGLEIWKNTKTLAFQKGREVHTTDLHTRRGVINHPKYSLGFDGKEVWLDQDSVFFKGNKVFYYNLYFYFYAMPFVLADDGIILESATPITYQNKEYLGIKVSYEANVGASPDDNYILYFDKETYQMEWLAYTVTFNSQKPSEKYSMIRYNKWTNTNGLLLPEEITWFKTDENGNPTEPRRSPVLFTNPLVSGAQLADSFYQNPKK